jgi:hypothetical protein
VERSRCCYVDMPSETERSRTDLVGMAVGRLERTQGGLSIGSSFGKIREPLQAATAQRGAGVELGVHFI